MIRGSAAVPGRKWCTAVAAAAFLVFGRVAAAQDVNVSGNPAAMRIMSATAGAQPNSVVESSTTYTFTSKANNQKIMARLSAPMPAGVTLTVTFDPPTGATSIPNVVLDGTFRTVVTNVDAFKKGVTKDVTYTLSATTAAGVVALQTRTIYLIVLDM
jgi:hypothetical protein